MKTEKPWGPKIYEDNLPMAFVGSLKDNRFEMAPQSKITVLRLSTSMARTLKSARRPAKIKQSMTSQFRNIPREQLY